MSTHLFASDWQLMRPVFKGFVYALLLRGSIISTVIKCFCIRPHLFMMFSNAKVPRYRENKGIVMFKNSRSKTGINKWIKLEIGCLDKMLSTEQITTRINHNIQA